MYLHKADLFQVSENLTFETCFATLSHSAWKFSLLQQSSISLKKTETNPPIPYKLHAQTHLPKLHTSHVPEVQPGSSGPEF